MGWDGPRSRKRSEDGGDSWGWGKDGRRSPDRISRVDGVGTDTTLGYCMFIMT